MLATLSRPWGGEGNPMLSLRGFYKCPNVFVFFSLEPTTHFVALPESLKTLNPLKLLQMMLGPQWYISKYKNVQPH